jgi:hypothetical protein
MTVTDVLFALMGLILFVFAQEVAGSRPMPRKSKKRTGTWTQNDSRN